MYLCIENNDLVCNFYFYFKYMITDFENGYTKKGLVQNYVDLKLEIALKSFLPSFLVAHIGI